MVDFGKIRYAWEHEPRLPISSPNKLFEHAEYRGVYEKAFGEDNKQVEVWSDKAINEAILAVHCFEFLTRTLSNEEEKTFELNGIEVPFQQLSRLRFYGLALMKIYADQYLHHLPETEREDLYAIKKKYQNFCSKSSRPIMAALKKTYREILKNKEGAAFALPRDGKIWESIRETFNDNMEMMRDL